MDFSSLKKYLDNRDRNLLPFCTFTVCRDHEVVFSYKDASNGYEDEFEKHDMYWLYSCSKVMTCTAFMRLVERGLCSLSDPLSKYIPEFADTKVLENGRLVPLQRPITLLDAITMTSGMTYEIKDSPFIQALVAKNPHASTREVASAIAANRLIFQPGTDYNYSLGHDIIAAVCEVVTGMEFRDFVKKEILGPLHMDNTFFRISDIDFSRMHTQLAVNGYDWIAKPTAMENIYQITDRYDSGGAGVMTTVEDEMRFLDALACGSSPDGYVVLKGETVADMTTNRLHQKALDTMRGPLRGSNLRSRWNGMGYGLGVRVLLDQDAQLTCAPKTDYGWDGAAGCYVSIDPASHTSSFFGTQVLSNQYGWDYTHRAIRHLTYDCLNK